MMQKTTGSHLGNRPNHSVLEQAHLAHVMKTHELISNFIEVCNLAIAKHKETILFRQLIGIANQVLAGRHFGVEVYKDEPDRTYDYYTISFEDDRLYLLEHGKESPMVEWKVSRDYLEQVVENPQDYIDNPLKLDWDWLLSRIGI